MRLRQQLSRRSDGVPRRGPRDISSTNSEIIPKPPKKENKALDTDRYATSIGKVFVAGDMRRGQSLVVWAIRDGQAAYAVDAFLMRTSTLPR
jgi:NADPH-dependent glutamate synthase beta subunit-like oxidoreductase